MKTHTAYVVVKVTQEIGSETTYYPIQTFLTENSAKECIKQMASDFEVKCRKMGVKFPYSYGSQWDIIETTLKK